MRLKIAVNTRLLLPGKLEGIGWFTYQTFQRIAKNHPEVEFHFLFDRPFDKQFVFSDNIKPVALFPPARHPLLYFIFFEKTIPEYLNKVKPDLFISPDGFLSLSWSGPQIAVIHDLNFMHFPAFVPLASRLYYRSMFPHFARKAIRIATVSEYSKFDIVKTFSIREDKIDVVYNGINENFKPVSEAEAIATRHRVTGGIPYFVYLGSLHKRKNIGNMLMAFEKFRQTHPGDFRLLIIGEPMFKGNFPKEHLRQMRFKDDVVFLGRLDGEFLNQVVASARGLLLVSYFEGFGIPIIEAMKCGVPVITSNVTSMPEIAGDAALLVNPSSPGEISDAMASLANQNELCKNLINRGRTVCKKFSWDATSSKMWDCIIKSL
ncbi:MAG TPA: glycosyltransferase family 1 protein [Bacteroidales bacterium]|nr:glycosyltransferase family 1 protein [Bacteroidales bacterium]